MNELTISILPDPQDITRLADYLAAMKTRTSRVALVPILMEHMQPIVAREKSILGPHSKSGALSMSLKARSGSGDRPGTISVFSAPTATRAALVKSWSGGRAQQKKWAAGMAVKRGRRAVFYADFVELGHRFVRRNAAGELKAVADSGGGWKTAKPVLFARGAMEELGDQQGEAAAEAVLTHIMEG